MFPVKMISSCTWLLRFRKSTKGFAKKLNANHPTTAKKMGTTIADYINVSIEAG
jgi:hypothetical protein